MNTIPDITQTAQRRVGQALTACCAGSREAPARVGELVNTGCEQAPGRAPDRENKHLRY